MAATVKDTTLLPEILGFPPQLLLDDLVNIFNNCVYQAVEAIEVYLQHWADSKPDDANNDALAQEIELGLHAFQTLLESHADLAFDFFEIWALRNVFTIPEGLPIIVPHQDGLDLQTPVETEKELQIEVEELRHKVENAKRLQELLERAKVNSATRLARAQARLQNLAFLADVPNSLNLPPSLQALHDSIQALPPAPPPHLGVDPTKRSWEASRAGYLDWAVAKIVDKTREPGEIQAVIEDSTIRATEIGTVEDVQRAAKRARR